MSKAIIYIIYLGEKIKNIFFKKYDPILVPSKIADEKVGLKKRVPFQKVFIFLILCGFCAQSFAQKGKDGNKYDSIKVMDEQFGIRMYEQLVMRLGGDSVRKCGNYACRGYIKDYYTTGEVLHIGYYQEGQLQGFKNFYPNGQIEREFKILDDFRSILSVYYASGQMKSHVKYVRDDAVLWQDYYENGNPSYQEEFDPKSGYYNYQKSYYENGNPRMLLEMENRKKLSYYKKEFYEDGQMKSQGMVVYNVDNLDFQKIGTWAEFDEKGTQIYKKDF